MEFKPKAKSTARPIPIPRRAESPTIAPLPLANALLVQGLQHLIRRHRYTTPDRFPEGPREGLR